MSAVPGLAVTSPRLEGREAELAACTALLDGLAQHGASLVIRGSAGIGKSELLSNVAEMAARRDVGVLRASGVQSETDLPFAGLHRLLLPAQSAIATLPAPLQLALSAAFGMTDEAAPDLFRIALATLELLAEVAADRPLLLVVDDAHWLDRTTCDVLTFVARRLEFERIGLLVSARPENLDGRFEGAELPELPLGPLGEASAAAVLSRSAPDLSLDVRQRLLREAEGNPLALIELPRALVSEQRGGEAVIPEHLPLTARLERAFATRYSSLGTETQTALLVAALDGEGVVGELLTAATAVHGSALTFEALAPAVAVHLIDVDRRGRLTFRHPLIRSAIYQRASETDRQAAHRGLAEAFAGQPDRRAWHLAAATFGPDEDAATQLESAAQTAQRRGAIVVAVAALERAAQLTQDPALRSRRLLRAATLDYELGRRDAVVRLLQEVEALEFGPREQAQLAWLNEAFEDALPTGSERIVALVDVADRCRLHGDSEMAMRFLAAAASRCWRSNARSEIRELVVAAAEKLPGDPDRPELLATFALGAPIARGTLVLERLDHVKLDVHPDPASIRYLGVAACAVGDFHRAERLLAAATTGLREQGRLGLVAQAQLSRAYAALYIGAWAEIEPAAAEAIRLADETLQLRFASAARIVEAALAGARGDYDRADFLLASVHQTLSRMGPNVLMTLAEHAHGLTALSAGRYGDAFERLRRMHDPSNPAFHAFESFWALPDLVEAAVRSGNVAAARDVVREAENVAAQVPSPLLRAGLRFARPFLAGDDDAESHFRDALAADSEYSPFLRARLLLAYGSWLRRRRRVSDARAPLRDARDGFDALNAEPWGDRARRELRASGEASRRRAPEARDELTPQEVQIAEMAAEGLSNREIGQQLYLSHRTVGAHLYRIYPKLGVTSRRQIGRALQKGSSTSS